jgi:putative ABC transport system permease protein
MHTDPGFLQEHVVAMRVDLPFTVYTDTARRTAFFTQVLEKVARIPQMQAAGVSDAIPFRMGSGWGIAIEGRPPLKPGEFNMAGVSRVSPGYLRAMGIRLLRGRGLTDADRDGSPLVAVITETMAKRYWPNGDPVGKRYRPDGPNTPWFTVVGVAADVKHWSISRPAAPESFLSYLQDAPTDMAVVLRTSGYPATIAAEVRRAVLAVDPHQPVGRAETMTAIVNESLAPQRVSAALAGIFGAIALGLALVGIYGVVACSVTERTREIGIRMALGANPAGVRGIVLRQALVLVAAGMVLGAAGALALTRLLGSTLYEVRATDPAAFFGAALAVLAAGLAAAWIPARRAAALAPSAALRHE